jgi:hypothetical protein
MQEEKITLDMLYELLKEFKHESNQKFDEMKKDTNQRFNDMKQDINRRFDDLNHKFDDNKQDVNNRFDRLENNMSADKEKLEEVYENHKKRIFGLNKLAVALNACLAFVVSYFVSRHGA